MKTKSMFIRIQQFIFLLIVLQGGLSSIRAEEVVIGEYTIRHTYIEDYTESWVEIFHRDKRVYQNTLGFAASRVNLTVEGGMARDAEGELYPLPLGEDLTGDGIPDAVIIESEFYSRDGICVMHLVELGDCFRHIATFSDCGHFEDHDQDGRFEVVLVDYTFAYWGEDGVWPDGPKPSVILRYDEDLDTFALAEDLMYRPAPSDEALERMIATIREARNDYLKDAPPKILWTSMLDLMYSGQEPVAWRLYDRAWQPHFGEKTTWAADFKAQLAQSQYWKQLHPLQIWDYWSVSFPDLLSRPSVSPFHTLPLQTAYKAQCGSRVACDAETCTTSMNAMYPDEFWYYSITETTPVYVTILVTHEGDATVYNTLGTKERLCDVTEEHCGDQLDAQCDAGTPVFLIHRSSRHVPAQ